jgi:polysaccharide export outer membrane protein
MKKIRQLRIISLTLLFAGVALLANVGHAQAPVYQQVGVLPASSVPAQVSGSVAGQVPAQTGSPSLIPRVAPESLLIGRGDQIAINVYNEPDQSQTVYVDDAGNVPLQMGGSVHVAGLTPEQAAKAISDHLREAQIMSNARVTVVVIGFATQAISVLGEVVKPGTVLVTTPRRILDVISLAGGFTAISDRLRVTVQHGSNPKDAQTVILSNAPDVALQSNNVIVYPGDTVVVPRAPVVYVVGDVAKPGAYVMQYDSHMTVLQAVAFAGGDQPDAKRTKVKLIRKTEGVTHEILVPFNAIEKGKAEDMPLMADDVLYVPFSFLKHFAVGGANIATSAASTAVYAIK